MNKFIRVALSSALAWGCLYGTSLAQQSKPERPMKLMVPFTPGGGTDIIARTLAPKLTEKLGTSVVVENMPGAAGAIAAQYTARAEADGSVLMVGSKSLP
jgi:tripartite-type tricarboxylate transporter receptor subunit TctC